MLSQEIPQVLQYHPHQDCSQVTQDTDFLQQTWNVPFLDLSTKTGGSLLTSSSRKYPGTFGPSCWTISTSEPLSFSRSLKYFFYQGHCQCRGEISHQRLGSRNFYLSYSRNKWYGYIYLRHSSSFFFSWEAVIAHGQYKPRTLFPLITEKCFNNTY